MKHSNNLDGKSKGALVVLLVWQILRLVLIVAFTAGAVVAVIVGFIKLVGVPMALVLLGATLACTPGNTDRRRAYTFIWW